MRRGDHVSLWCEGIRPKPVHSEVSDSESCSDDEGPLKKKRRRKRKLSALGETNNRVEDVVSTLRGKHSDQYTTIQYRLWAEMIDVGTHRLGISCIHIQYCICFGFDVCTTFTYIIMIHTVQITGKVTRASDTRVRWLEHTSARTRARANS